jgi:hypothetical protein
MRLSEREKAVLAHRGKRVRVFGVAGGQANRGLQMMRARCKGKNDRILSCWLGTRGDR